MGWLEDAGGGESERFISLKLGEKETFVVKSLEKTTDNPDWHPKKKDKTTQGWHLLITATDGRILEVGNFALQTALREAGLKDRDNPQGPLVGRTLTITHEDRSSYQVAMGKATTLPTEDVPF